MENADLISLLAAPIYAALIARALGMDPIPASDLEKLRAHAITQARALWLQTRDTP